MSVTVVDMKTWLRVDSSEDDDSISSLIEAAKIYITNGSGHKFETENPLADLAVRVLVAHWYENREAVLVGSISKGIEFSLQSIFTQLSYCVPDQPVGEGE